MCISFSPQGKKIAAEELFQHTKSQMGEQKYSLERKKIAAKE